MSFPQKDLTKTLHLVKYRMAWPTDKGVQSLNARTRVKGHDYGRSLIDSRACPLVELFTSPHDSLYTRKFGLYTVVGPPQLCLLTGGSVHVEISA